ncbi:MAG: peptidoglycan DD-metalloendopeptidase family protein [Candidatus Paceibacterota bacterium]
MQLFLKHWRELIFGLFSVALLATSIVAGPTGLQGSEIDDLRRHIQERQGQIDNLEKEIKKYENELNQTSAEAETIEQKLAELRASRSKLEAEIGVAQNQISSKSYTIDKLALEMGDIEERVALHREAVAEILREIDQEDNTTLIEAMLIHGTISGLWDEIESLDQLQEGVHSRIESLIELREEMEEKQIETIQTKEELEKWRATLSDKKQILESNEHEQSKVLGATRSKEEQYRAILAEKNRQHEEFEKDVARLESELQIAIDPNKFPERGTGVLASPVPDMSLRSCWDGGGSHANCVTQYFGHTSFSKRTAAYKGNGHNGLDFRTSVGTPISAPLGGVVRATGNTDAIPGCYSYGKWVLLEHSNGLSTMYAHLSLIKVSQGQGVSTGDVIGYAGNTGFSTGPHLHFTVYATEGVRVVKYTSSNGCKDATIPIADLNAYLDPIDYLK